MPSHPIATVRYCSPRATQSAYTPTPSQSTAPPIPPISLPALPCWHCRRASHPPEPPSAPAPQVVYSAEAGKIPMHFVLQYDLVDDYVARRGAFRQQHLSLASQAYERGELVIAGALAEPADGALLVFRGPSAEHQQRSVGGD